MLRISIKSRSEEQNIFPILGYPGYVITKLYDSLNFFSIFLNNLETLYLRKKINEIKIKEPIYITGLPRSGTTITLEMLSKHPDLASHRYKHLIMPYIPFWFSRILNRLGISMEPTERLHNDRIIISEDSPEAVEEIFWQKFFREIHYEKNSCLIEEDAENSEFEKFYKNHIRKLILSQDSSRYLAKNNYNITRLGYILKIFPDAKFLLLIRDPINQVASLVKQQKLFLQIEQSAPLMAEWNKMLGHHEFGNRNSLLNLNNYKETQKIREFLQNKDSMVIGWAHYWNMVYNYIYNILKDNEQIKKATLIVRYNELCEKSLKVIDEILEHTKLENKKFLKVKQFYTGYLKKPQYYKPNFTERELNQILQITNSTAGKFGVGGSEFS